MTVAFSPANVAPAAPTAPAAPAAPAASAGASWQSRLGLDTGLGAEGGLDSLGGAARTPPPAPAAPAAANEATVMLSASAVPPRRYDPSDTQPSAFAASSANDATVMSNAPAASGRLRADTNALEVSADDLANIRTSGERDAEEKKKKQASRSRALLDEQQSLAEKAVEAHDWKKAVHYYSIAAALAPDDSSIREALNRARDERKRASKSDG
jgi:hypothetical protein